MYPDVKPQNGSQLVQELKERLEKLFNRKVRAINVSLVPIIHILVAFSSLVILS